MKLSLLTLASILALQPASAIDVTFTDTQSIKDGAATVAYDLLKFYTGNNTGDVDGNLPDPYYWWECGAMFGLLVDYWWFIFHSFAMSTKPQTIGRITHPIYLSNGQLSCLLCDEIVTNEASWTTHLASTGHQARAQQLERTHTGHKRPLMNGTKEDEDVVMTSDSPAKRPRPNDLEIGIAGTPTGRRLSGAPGAGMEITMATRPATPKVATTADKNGIDAPGEMANAESQDADNLDDEWAAFEADIAATSTVYDNATVSAAALTREQVEEKQAAKKEPVVESRETMARRVEGEKEDATRQLEMEFDEMAELELHRRGA